MAMLANLEPETQAAAFPPFILIGLGPYAKRHYFNLFSKFESFPRIVIDLDSKKDDIEKFFSSKRINIPLLLVPKQYRNSTNLPPETKRQILAALKQHGVQHAILATEPKSHLAYIDFLIENGVQILIEKPLTSPPFASFSLEAAQQIEDDYFYLRDKGKNVRIDLQCQRRYHPIYQFVMKEISAFVSEFDIPMTYCEIYHCDGMWNMPDEFISRENHPYKYGYGKLLHSGYHFIDLLAWLIQTGNRVCSKAVDRAELFATSFSPSDSLSAFNQADYKRFFPKVNYASVFENKDELGFDQFGELDFFGILQLFQGDKKMSTCCLNLLQNGFSRRSWSELPEDTYKSNGRIRHERLNVQFGPLLNIQVHSYLSEEDKESSFSSLPGGKNHFDVLIFRNSSLIGGKPFTRLRSDDFLESGQLKSFNEISREKCFTQFLLGEPSLSNLNEHALSIQILSHSLKSLCKKNQNQPSNEAFFLKR